LVAPTLTKPIEFRLGPEIQDVTACAGVIPVKPRAAMAMVAKARMLLRMKVARIKEVPESRNARTHEADWLALTIAV
jgi:hypothetical protein